MKLVRITRDKEATLWPLLIERVDAFSRSFGANPTDFVVNLWSMFATRSSAFGAWAMLTDDGQMVGHAVVTLDFWQGERVTWIHQVKTDIPAARDLVDEWLLAVEAWTADANRQLAPSGQRITATLFATHRETEAWARHAGFDRHRVIYRRPVRS